MEIVDEPIEGLFVLKQKVLGDERGFFMESFRSREFSKLVGNQLSFVQDNLSKSSKNVLRGMHFQAPPNGQGKLVTVLTGAVLDVVVDIRKSSPSYGQSFAIELNEHNKLFMFVPEGFAHGFCTLEDNTLFMYKCTDYYNKDSEGSFRWDDPSLDIPWGVTDPIVSEKDRNAPLFSEFESPFK